MSGTNGSTASPPRAVAKSMGELTQDIVALAELQFELLRIDSREGFKRMLIPLGLFLAAAAVAVGSVPVALVFLAALLVQAAGLSIAAAFLIATLVGLLAAGTIGILAWITARGALRVFARSGEEFTRNFAWIKRALQRPAPGEFEPPESGPR